MKFTMMIVIAVCMVALVNSIPVADSEEFRLKVLERLMLVENENDTALRSKRAIGILRQLFPTISEDVNSETQNQAQDVGVASSENNEVRVQFDDNQETSANEPDLVSLDDIGGAEDDNRNKRFLSFGLGGSGNSNSGGSGSGGGSGNFLFDIIRQAADGAARAAGTVYRVVAGTQSLGLGLSASRDLGPSPSASSAAPAGVPTTAIASAPTAIAPATGAGTQPSLVAGSGASQGDPSGTGGRTDEAVPGPITRLFVIANRGISNLIQDIILRLAATSERIVNFKARLITSII